MSTEHTESRSLRELTDLNTIDYETFIISDYIAFPQRCLSFVLQLLTLLNQPRIHANTRHRAPSESAQSNLTVRKN